jgi:nicotinamide riboside kinase
MNKPPTVIVITGPESCGKTTLVHELSRMLPNTRSVLEYAREYLELKGKTVADSAVEVMEILSQHAQRVEDYSKEPLDYIIVDTDEVSHIIWSDEVFGVMPERKDYLHPKLTLLCAPDIPWIPDPMRVNPLDRDRLFERYIEELNRLKRPFEIVRAKGNQRLMEAIKHLKQHGINVQDSL